jgi:hypothetical protein
VRSMPAVLTLLVLFPPSDVQAQKTDALARRYSGDDSTLIEKVA